MTTAPALGATLLLTGLLTGLVLLAQASAVRHLPASTIPDVLRSRVVLGSRLRPYLLASVVAMLGIGLVLAVLD